MNINLRHIKDINSWGFDILYLKELDIFLTEVKFTPSQVNNGIDYHEVKGVDITTEIHNFSSNYDKGIFSTRVEKLTQTHMKLHKDVEFYFFMV